MIIQDNKHVLRTNIDNFDTYQIEINSIAVKNMIDMYSDKELAVVRELLTNAWDSHIASNNTDKAIDVDLFYTNENIFRIRDYGTGISKEDMKKYCTIFHSSKRDTNTQTGCFGVGSKVPFAIVDNYIVHTYYEGKKYSYLMSLSDVLPKFVLLSEIDTNEPNGLEIEIEIPNDGKNNHKYRIIESINRFNAFSGVELNILSSNSVKKPEIIYETENFKMFHSYDYNNGVYILYGNNYYNLPKNIVFYHDIESEINKSTGIYSNTLKCVRDSLLGIYTKSIIKIPLSAGLTITPSRENIEQTDRNKDIILEYITKAKEQILNDDFKKIEVYNKNGIIITDYTVRLKEILKKTTKDVPHYLKINSYNKITEFTDNRYENTKIDIFDSAIIDDEKILTDKFYKTYICDRLYPSYYQQKIQSINSLKNRTNLKIKLIINDYRLNKNNIVQNSKIFKTIFKLHKINEYDNSNLYILINNSKEMSFVKAMLKLIDLDKSIEIEKLSNIFNINNKKKTVNFNNIYNKYKIKHIISTDFRNIYRYNTVKQFITKCNEYNIVVYNQDMLSFFKILETHKNIIPNYVFNIINNYLIKNIGIDLNKDIDKIVYVEVPNLSKDEFLNYIKKVTDKIVLDYQECMNIINFILNKYAYLTNSNDDYFINLCKLVNVSAYSIRKEIKNNSMNYIDKKLLWLNNLYKKHKPNTITGKFINNYVNKLIKLYLVNSVLYKLINSIYSFYMSYGINTKYKANSVLTSKNDKIKKIYKKSNFISGNYFDNKLLELEINDLKQFIYKISYTKFNKNKNKNI